MMVLNWDTAGDFAEVVDTLESVTLLSQCGLEEVVIEGAWRFSESVSEVRGTESAVLRRDAVWQLPYTTGEDPPLAGDRLLDSSAACWTLTQVDRLQGKTRYRCEARLVEIRAEAAEWIDQQHAVWGMVEVDGEPTQQITGWETERQALRGHIWRVATTTVGAESETLLERFRIVFTEPVTVSPHHRFRTHAGQVYRVVDSELGRGVGDLWTVEVTQTAA